MINKVLEKSFSGALFFCIQSEAKGFSVDLPDQIFYNSSNPVTTDSNRSAIHLLDRLQRTRSVGRLPYKDLDRKILMKTSFQRFFRSKSLHG